MNWGRSPNWPPSENQAGQEGQKTSSFEFDHISCSDSVCTFLFKMYKYPTEEEDEDEDEQEEEEKQSTSATTSATAAAAKVTTMAPQTDTRV